jgi:RNA polymerase sigma factor (TIGR02999 family)
MPDHQDRPDLTEWLQAAQAGDAAAAQQAFKLLYPELQRIARSRLRGHQVPTLLDTESLVHESFLRFAQGAAVDFASRKHFYAWVAKAMRHVVVDFVRRRQAQQRGGDLERVTLCTEADQRLGSAQGAQDLEVERLHEALERVAQLDPQLAELVELRFFGGYSEQESAALLGVSERTLRRQWQKARAALLVELS